MNIRTIKPFFMLTIIAACLNSGSQVLSPGQLELGKERLASDTALAKKARQALEEDPSIIDRVPAERRDEVIDALKPNSPYETQGPVLQETPPPIAVEAGIPTPAAPSSEASLSARAEEKRKIPYDRIHGRSLFTDFTQPATIPEIPEDYVIMPGDEILMRLWGRYNLDKKYVIGKDGYVFLDPLNKQMYLLGMTHGRLKDMLRTITRDVPGVEGEARILTTRTVKIHVSGEAKNPGTIAIPPYYTFWQALMTSQGPGDLGSIRKIRLLRNGKNVNTLDIYSYLRTGMRPQQTVKDGDVIFFDRIDKAAGISGFVQRDGWYELKENETLGDLVAFAGGMTASEYSAAGQIDRLIPVNERKQDGPTRTVIDLDLAGKSWKKQAVLDGDIVSTKEKQTRYENAAFIMGKGIPVPGRYSIVPGTSTVRDLVRKAGGLVDGFHPRGEIERTDDAGRRSVPLDLSDPGALEGTTVMPGDTVRTYHEREFRDLTTVKSSGFVRDAIEVPYADSISLLSLIKRSGGTRDGALDFVYIKKTDDWGNISYVRKDIGDSGVAAKVILDPRDEVIAFDYRSFNRTFPVGILAYGSTPILVEYSRDLTLDLLILRLGGLNPLIDSSAVEIVTPEMKETGLYSTTEKIVLNASTSQDPSLILPGMLVILRKDPRKNQPHFVTIIGEVQAPGFYPMKSMHDNIATLIEDAGGLTSRANPYSLRIRRDGYQRTIPVQTIRKSPLKLKNRVVLNSGDSIFVERNDYLVTINGAVFAPGISAYNENFSWKDYIRNGAGGWLDSADVRKTYIMYPNGMKFKAHQGLFRFDPRVVPGSKIVVPFKPPKPPAAEKKEFDYMKFASFMSVMATTMLTLVLITDKVK